MRHNNLWCEGHLELHPHGVRDQDNGIIYSQIQTLTSERGCGDCLDMYKCKFAKRILDIIEKKDSQIFKRTPKDNVYRNDPIK